MKVPVSIGPDLTIGPTVHMCWPELLDCYATMNWAPGAAAGKHSLSSRVLHKGHFIVLDGHDLGPQLPHAPLNHFLNRLKSSRKTNYAASTVLAERKAIACVDGAHVMMLCGDPVNLPIGWNTTNALHSVFVGTTSLDELKGDVSINASMLVDVICLPLELAEKPVEIILDQVGLDPKKMLTAQAVSLASSVAVSCASGWKEPITMKREWGTGHASGSTEWTYDPQTGQTSTKDTTNIRGHKTERTENDLFSRDPVVGPLLGEGHGDLPGEWVEAAL